MLDISLLRSDFENTVKKLKRRNQKFEQLNDFAQYDSKWRELSTKLQKLNQDRNEKSKKISLLMAKKEIDEANKIKTEVTNFKNEITKLEQEINVLEGKLKEILLTIPNIPYHDVPDGKDENDNKVVNVWGKPTEFNFKYLPHWDLATKLGLIDFERSTKISGSRFIIYTNEGAKLIRALQQYTLDENSEAGFTEMLPPVIINDKSLIGTGQLPKFEEDLFKLNNGMYLSPTGEVQLTNFYRDEILKESQLPIYLTTNTSCFRSEAGSAGKDTRGVIRQHQFYKTEMVMIANPSDSYKHHEVMTRQAEKLLEKLELPYRRIVLCAGDMGFSSAKTYDIEVWMPSNNCYREISSCSNCEAFQARRLKLRYKDSNGKTQYTHTLNGSGLAIDRLWAAVVENCQQADGRIKIPKALRKYLNNKEYLG